MFTVRAGRAVFTIQFADKQAFELLHLRIQLCDLFCKHAFLLLKLQILVDLRDLRCAERCRRQISPVNALPSLQTPQDKVAAFRIVRWLALLNMVGLNREHMNRFPHEFSGGQRQRIGIARALAVDPKLVVCDEPISALDVSIQAQIVNLMMKLQQERGLSYLFITHDLSMVRQISDRIAVMYLGSIMEMAPSDVLYKHHQHPYTKALLSAIPSTDILHPRKRIVLNGEITSPIDPPPGCRFADRCAYATEACRQPQKLEEVKPGHFVACCRLGEIHDQV